MAAQNKYSFEFSKVAVVLIDPLKDFLHPKGKIYPLIQDSLVATDTNNRLQELVKAARDQHIPIYYASHQTWKVSNYNEWKRMNAALTRNATLKPFAEGSFGAEYLEGLEPDVGGNGDVVVSRHWNSSGFANTDLDYQLRQRGNTHLVMAGMIAETCFEATARYARELGYHVTLLTDGTAGFTEEAKNTAARLVWPIIAEEVMTVGEWIGMYGILIVN
ncbi:Isochorismatase hydrolase [Thozetella sp. PMI_491]|nr:Isochorismatase hydrolase [Thozetella sp. PMI_491]